MAHVFMFQLSTLEELELIVEDFAANMKQEDCGNVEKIVEALQGSTGWTF